MRVSIRFPCRFRHRLKKWLTKGGYRHPRTHPLQLCTWSTNRHVISISFVPDESDNFRFLLISVNLEEIYKKSMFFIATKFLFTRTSQMSEFFILMEGMKNINSTQTVLISEAKLVGGGGASPPRIGYLSL